MSLYTFYDQTILHTVLHTYNFDAHTWKSAFYDFAFRPKWKLLCLFILRFYIFFIFARSNGGESINTKYMCARKIQLNKRLCNIKNVKKSFNVFPNNVKCIRGVYCVSILKNKGYFFSVAKLHSRGDRCYKMNKKKRRARPNTLLAQVTRTNILANILEKVSLGK